MNCEVARLRLLSTLDPSRAPAEVRAHLFHCESCRDWRDDLCTIEQHISYVPVPSSRGKQKTLRRLLDQTSPLPDTLHQPEPKNGPTLPETGALTLPDSTPLRHPRFFSFPGLMAGLAAVALFVLGTGFRRN